MSGVIRFVHTKPRTLGERGIPKIQRSVIRLEPAGVVGDYNRYRVERKRGDLNKAVLLLPQETLQALNAEGWPVAPGHLGENITTAGIAYPQLQQESLWRIGQVELQISEPCDPCNNLRVLPYVGSRVAAFVKALLGRRGWYARVLQPGDVRPGDLIERL